MNMTYEEAKQQNKMLNDKVDELSKQLNLFPRESNGMVNDETRNTVEFQQVDRLYKFYFKQLQDSNKYMLKHFKKEYLTERANKRKFKK